MKTKHNTYSLAATLITSTLLGLAAIGCGSDPNGSAGGGGAGGNSGGGGAGGAAPALGAIKGTAVQTFDTGVAGFLLSAYMPPATSGETNLAPTSMLTWDATEGSPSPGSLKIVAPFSDWNQWIEVQAATQAPLLGWSGKKMHVRLKVAMGLGSDMYALSGAQALVDATSAYVQVNAARPIQLGNQWQDFEVDLSTTAAPFDASMVITYGIHIYSGAGNLTAAKPTTATLYVDSFSIE